MNEAPNGPYKLLISTNALREWGDRIKAVLPDGQLQFILAEVAGATEAPCEATIAFMTREVTGNSSKGNPTPELRNFAKVLRKSPSLRWLQIHPAGAELPIYKELRARGVKITTASGATAATVAHSALGGLIAINRCFPLLMDAQRRHAWEPRLGPKSPRDLGGQTAVIVGLGPIGQKLGVLLKALDMQVIGVRRTPQELPMCDRTITYDQLASVLHTADVIILCCPASDITRKLVDARFLASMRPGSLLVNVARGEVVMEADLVAALASGHIAGAFLDVFEREPLDTASPLWEMSNVIVTPHTASHSLGQNEAILEIFLDNLPRWIEGRPLRNDVDRLE